MGLFGKIKNIFYDEEIIEVPSEEIKKEEKPKVEEVRPIIKKGEAPTIKTVNTNNVPVYSERELFKSESTFKFPVIDEDEEDDTPIRTRSRVNVLDMERTPKREEEKKRDFRFNDTKVSNERNGEKVFKPSPVISPVYGVLDKNYRKEEIIERQQSTVRHNLADMNYDSVRRKAYGTLEDELENTLTRISEKNNTIENELNELEEEHEEVNSKSIEDLLSEIEENRNVSIGEIEERIKDRLEQEEEDQNEIGEHESKVLEDEIEVPSEEVEESIEEEVPFDKTLEHDLFNLIDSMYEEKEGEE